MSIERRRFPRVPIHLEVAWASADQVRRDLTHDVTDEIGLGGLFLRTSQPLPIGTELRLSLRLPGEDGAIELRGRVAWLKRGGGAGEGMGIQFLDPPPPALAALAGD